MTTYTLNLNGAQVRVEADGDTPLLWVLRDQLGLTGTKYACGQGLCGCCTVLVDGEAVRSCTAPISSLGDKPILTIEGLSADGSHPVQVAWIEERVTQCGYCQPGQIMSAAALLAKIQDPTDQDIDAAMSSTLCRCGTYQRVRLAIHRAASLVNGG
jgi:aerobic-type carbon monoxide dehydrogenase small subunit (CoxS/CutS family)